MKARILSDAGFTLIELLVVVAIIGILAAIAIPQYTEYRVRAYNSTTKADLRGVILAEEAYIVDNNSYTSCADVLACEAILPGFAGTRDEGNNPVMSTFTVETADATVLGNLVPEGRFIATAKHTSGSTTYEWDSEDGSMTPND